MSSAIDRIKKRKWEEARIKIQDRVECRVVLEMNMLNMDDRPLGKHLRVLVRAIAAALTDEFKLKDNQDG